MTSNHVNEYDFTGLLRGVLWLVQICHVTLANQWKRTTRLDVRDQLSLPGTRRRTKDSGTVEYRISLKFIKILNTIGSSVRIKIVTNSRNKKRQYLISNKQKAHLQDNDSVATITCSQRVYHPELFSPWTLGALTFSLSLCSRGTTTCKNGFSAPDLAIADRSPVKNGRSDST